MNKTVKSILLLLVAVLFVFTSCDGNMEKVHEHTLVTKSNETQHWVECTTCDFVGEKENHTYESNKCSCGAYDKAIEIGDTYYDELLPALEYFNSMKGTENRDVTINIVKDTDMTDVEWIPFKVDGYHGAGVVTIEGNGHKITNLCAPLFEGGFAGTSGVVIHDLTIADSKIVSNNNLGIGAFIECVDSMPKIELKNCHLINSSISQADETKEPRVGGLIGWTAGYNNPTDGPVKTYVTIEGCSVEDCSIEGIKGSVGGIIGHAGANAWTFHTITDCTVKNTKLGLIDDGGWRVGVVVGTANVGEITITGTVESGNTLSQTEKTAPEHSNLYGRFVPGTTGKLTIDGEEIAK